MTVGELLESYVETMNRDTVRIYVTTKYGTNELVYQDHIFDLKEEVKSLKVKSWFATPLKGEDTDTEITIFVDRKDFKNLNLQEEELQFGDSVPVLDVKPIGVPTMNFFPVTPFSNETLSEEQKKALRAYLDAIARKWLS